MKKRNGVCVGVCAGSVNGGNGRNGGICLGVGCETSGQGGRGGDGGDG
ncbi:hypothetical protein ACWC0C_12210 [Streptomyces sp. NPDC001709]